ncbi:MAG: hypothetical protein DMG05_06980 [Acidobacteria bacterium]|nr:MAG: hypothetical protein DMG05_06980 [Acidobacteriota bacterium]
MKINQLGMLTLKAGRDLKAAARRPLGEDKHLRGDSKTVGPTPLQDRWSLRENSSLLRHDRSAHLRRIRDRRENHSLNLCLIVRPTVLTGSAFQMRAMPNGRCSRKLPPGRIETRHHSDPGPRPPHQLKTGLGGSVSLPKPDQHPWSAARGISTLDLKGKAAPGIVSLLAPSPVLHREPSGGVRLGPGKRCVPPVHAHLKDHRWKCANPSLPSAPLGLLREAEIVESAAAVSAWSAVEVAAPHQLPPIAQTTAAGANILEGGKKVKQ